MMDAMTLEEVVRKFDLRFDRIEQFLPTLATKAELQDLRAELRAEMATKAELQETRVELQEVRAEMATKAELQESRVATRADLQELRVELRTESADTRRYMKMLVEDLRGEIRLTMEGLVDLDARDARQHAERLRDQAGLDRRVTALEARRRPSRPR